MVDYVPLEKGNTIRQPSTANLMISASDRVDISGGIPYFNPTTKAYTYTNYPSPFNFSITKNQSILNGFFTRIATSEVVLEWFQANVGNKLGNNKFSVNILGTDYEITLLDNTYTVSQLLDAIVAKLNAVVGISGVYVFSIVTGNPNNGIKCETVAGPANQDYLINKTVLANYLDITYTSVAKPIILIGQPDIRPYRYIDFISPQLTYAQDLKDASTNFQDNNVLCRWYFAFDNQNTTNDTYGYPILMGYQPFCIRRTFNPPKQIRWEPNLPIGNISFRVVDELGVIVPNFASTRGESSWLMTLQVSEV
jgi:hypothetical protein